MKLVLCLVAVLPPVYAALIFLWPPFPRFFSREAWLPGGACAAWALAAMGLAIEVPEALPLAAIAGAALAGFMARGYFAVWFGPRDVPPGSMSFAKGVRALSDRSFYLDEFRRNGPIFKSTQFGAPIICVSGMERICQLMRGHAAQLGPSPLAITQSILGNFLRYMDNDTHDRYGGLFRRAMAGSASPGAEEHLRVRCRGALAALVSGGLVSPKLGLRRYTRESLDLLLFGFMGSDERSLRFGVLADRFYDISVGQALARSDRRLLEEMESLLVEHLNAGDRGGASPESVIARLRSLDGGMPDRVCLDNLVLMHKIATSNVSSLLLWLLFHWGTQPGVVAAIRALPSAERSRGLDAFLSETLRLSQSEYLYRRVTQEFRFEGFDFPRGWMVRSCIWESHRTTDALADPSEFRLRLEPGDYGRDHFSPFGMGRHACNGVDITYTIAKELLSQLADNFDVAISQGEPFQRPMRHWGHWQPNHAMKVRFKALE
jgi:cytochrome P450